MNHYLKHVGRRVVVIILCGLLLRCIPAFGADVKGYQVFKMQQWFQDTSGPPVPYTSQQYLLAAYVVLTSFDSVTAATLEDPTGREVTMSFNTATQYVPPRYQFLIVQGFTNRSSLDATWPNGNYTLSMATAHDGLKTAVLNLSGNLYPANPPHIQNYLAAQSVNASSDFALQWDAFLDGTTNDFIYVEAFRVPDGIRVFRSPEPNEPAYLTGKAVSAVIPAGALAAGQTYYVRVRFDKIITVNRSSYPGVLGGSTYEKSTLFTLTTDAASTVGPTLQIRCSPLRVCWDTAPTKSYQLQYRSDLLAGQWVNAGGVLSGAGSPICITNDGAGATKRFYRVIVVQ